MYSVYTIPRKIIYYFKSKNNKKGMNGLKKGMNGQKLLKMTVKNDILDKRNDCLSGGMKMKIAICDDERAMRDSLIGFLNEYSEINNTEMDITEFSSGDELLSGETDFDIVFMDYQMEGIDGMETSRRYRAEKSPDTTLIFISSFPLIALESFEVNTFRFLTKPIDREKLFKAIDDYIVSYNNKFVILKSGTEHFIVNTDDIIYAEAKGKQTIVRTIYDTVLVSRTLREIEKDLPFDKFYRCQKSFIINLMHVESFNTSEIFLDNGEKAILSKRMYAQFKSDFQKFIMKSTICK